MFFSLPNCSSSCAAITSPCSPEFSAICIVGFAQRLGDNIESDLLVAFCLALFLFDFGYRPQKRHAAARHDAFLRRGPCRVQRVIEQVLFLFHFGFSCRSRLDYRDAAGEFR